MQNEPHLYSWQISKPDFILQHVPESLECLTRLVTLKLDDNQLEKLPDNLGRMTSLEELYGAENFLTYLPPRWQYPSCWSSRHFTNFWMKCWRIIFILVSGGWGGFTRSMWMKMISRWERDLQTQKKDLKGHLISGDRVTKWSTFSYFRNYPRRLARVARWRYSLYTEINSRGELVLRWHAA